jgi:dihydroxy-acid dehydratase
MERALHRLRADGRCVDAQGNGNHLRGWPALYRDHVLQAPDGCDLDFLRGRSPVVADAVTYL